MSSRQSLLGCSSLDFQEVATIPSFTARSTTAIAASHDGSVVVAIQRPNLNPDPVYFQRWERGIDGEYTSVGTALMLPSPFLNTIKISEDGNTVVLWSGGVSEDSSGTHSLWRYNFNTTSLVWEEVTSFSSIDNPPSPTYSINVHDRAGSAGFVSDDLNVITYLTLTHLVRAEFDTETNTYISKPDGAAALADYGIVGTPLDNGGTQLIVALRASGNGLVASVQYREFYRVSEEQPIPEVKTVFFRWKNNRFVEHKITPTLSWHSNIVNLSNDGTLALIASGTTYENSESYLYNIESDNLIRYGSGQTPSYGFLLENNTVFRTRSSVYSINEACEWEIIGTLPSFIHNDKLVAFSSDQRYCFYLEETSDDVYEILVYSMTCTSKFPEYSVSRNQIKVISDRFSNLEDTNVDLTDLEARLQAAEDWIAAQPAFWEQVINSLNSNVNGALDSSSQTRDLLVALQLSTIPNIESRLSALENE